MGEQNLGISFLNLSHPGCPAVFNSCGSPAAVFPIPRPERPSSPGVSLVSCLALGHKLLTSGQRLLCPVPSSPADSLLLTVQNLQVFPFYIMVRFCHHVLQRNQSLITRCGSPLVESQGPLSVLLSPNWFLEKEGEERRTFAALGCSWFSFLPAACLWAGDPIGSVFPSSGPGAIGPLNKGERLTFFTLLGPSLVPSLFSQASLWCSWKKKLKADTG